jgi:polyadenylate-binding protein
VVLKDSEGKSKGFGFVCFERSEDAEEAFKNMQNKSIWRDQPPIYVNFAMKKSERLEHLQRKREETFKNAQKMTVFAKIKDENAIKSEMDFIAQIKNYLNAIFQKEYEPRSIKVRFETKNAFITMNSQRDSEEFIRKFQEFAKENQTSLFFNLYKSKVERISANAYFKKYNAFSNEEAQGQARYRRYNQAVGQPVNQEFPYSAINQPGQVRYNNFEEMNQMNNQGRYISYNNFPQQMPPKETKFQPQQPKFDPTDEDSIGEYLYGFVEKIYPE